MEVSKRTQKQMLLRHMVEIGPITKAEAHRLYFIENVGGRIEDLRKDGYNIPNPARKVQLVEGGSRVALYEIVKGETVWVQHSVLCSCGRSYYTKDGRCTRCGRVR